MDYEYTNPAGFGTTTTESVETPSGSADRPGDQARRLVLAGIGAVAEVCDTAEQTFDRLVDRGEAVQHDWQAQAEQMRLRNAGARGRMQRYFRNAMDAVLDGLSVPNKADVDTINVKLNILTRKIDDLQMSQARETTPPLVVPEPPTSTGDLAT